MRFQTIGAKHPLDWADAIAALLLGAGLLVRIAISSPNIFFEGSAGEAKLVALAFAHQGTLADAYFQGQGPTAHLMPVMPVIAGMIHRLFGVGSPSAHAVLLLWAVIQVMAAYTLTYLVFRRLGFSRSSRTIAALLLCLPVFSNAEIRLFRYWDGALCVALVSYALLRMTTKRDALTDRDIGALALLAGATTFVNPVVGLALFGCIGAYCYGFGFTYFFKAALIGGAVTALLLLPWVARNQIQLDHAIVRSNFWLEVSMANNPDAVKPVDPQRNYLERMAELHPYKSLSAQQEVRAIGEVAYYSKLKSETTNWIQRNPGTFVMLSLQHLRDFYFPPPWSYDFWEKPPIRRLASVVVPTLHFLGLIWLLVGAWMGRPLHRPILAFVCIVGLPYALVQPLPRYSYVIYPILAFLATDLIARSGGVIARSYSRTFSARNVSVVPVPPIVTELSVSSRTVRTK